MVEVSLIFGPGPTRQEVRLVLPGVPRQGDQVVHEHHAYEIDEVIWDGDTGRVLVQSTTAP